MAKDTYVLVLEKLRRPEEQCRSLLCAERLADIEEVDNAREQRPALAGAYGGFIEDTGLLDDGGLIVVVCAEAALLVLFRCESHSGKRKARAGAPSSTTWKQSLRCCETLSSAHSSSQLSHVAHLCPDPSIFCARRQLQDFSLNSTFKSSAFLPESGWDPDTLK